MHPRAQLQRSVTKPIETSPRESSLQKATSPAQKIRTVLGNGDRPRSSLTLHPATNLRPGIPSEPRGALIESPSGHDHRRSGTESELATILSAVSREVWNSAAVWSAPNLAAESSSAAWWSTAGEGHPLRSRRSSGSCSAPPRESGWLVLGLLAFGERHPQAGIRSVYGQARGQRRARRTRDWDPRVRPDH